MRKFIVVTALLLLLAFAVFKTYPKKTFNLPVVKPTISAGTPPTIPPRKNVSPVQKTVKSIFVPDWTLNDESILHNGYDRWIYFGDQSKLPTFFSALSGKNLWLTYKIDSVEALNQLSLTGDDPKINGVVLDLEINGIASPELINKINSGVQKLYSQAKNSNIRMALALYGDLFYRKRPYDLAFLEKNSDEVMVMAYDFNKSYGEPGPNFPIEQFKNAVEEYAKYVPEDRLTVIFGMFGYDWTLSDGKPLKAASAISLGDIREKFAVPRSTDQLTGKIKLKKCTFDSCFLNIDPVSREKYITYTDEGFQHKVYFEDEESQKVKTDFLMQNGIGSISFWAFGYF